MPEAATEEGNTRPRQAVLLIHGIGEQTIVGGDTLLERYMIRVRDPGPKWSAFTTLVRRLSQEPIVQDAVEQGLRGGGSVRGAMTKARTL